MLERCRRTVELARDAFRETVVPVRDCLGLQPRALIRKRARWQGGRLRHANEPRRYPVERLQFGCAIERASEERRQALADRGGLE